MIVLSFQQPADIETAAVAAARHLRAGGLLAYPTETVYGFGSALEPAPLARLARLKRRDAQRPFLVLVDDVEMLPGVRWTAVARELAARFWPGPLTLVLDGDPMLPDAVRGPDGGIALRLSPHPGVVALIRALGAPITSTSANPPGRPPAIDAAQATAAVRQLGDETDWIVLDGGALEPSPPSTIVRCSADRVAVVRAGAVPLDQLRAVVKEIDV